MSRFLFKLSLVAIPLVVLTIFYIVNDPFKVIWAYGSFYRSGYPSVVTMNRDFVSLETFQRHEAEERWDSFIFGNSRSIFYEVKDWTPYIGSNRTFHFDASGESLYGITRKLQFLDEHHVPVRNALIILDVGTLSVVTNSQGHLSLKHPLLSGQSWLDFQQEFFKAFLSSRFLLAYLDYSLTHRVKKYMKAGYLLSDHPIDYDLRHNEIRFGTDEQLIRRNPDAYYAPRAAIFYTRSVQQAVSAPAIKQPQITMLLEMAMILNSQHSNYRLIINPLYDQKQLSPADLSCLKQIFGPDRVYDFSGINDITKNYRNYYEDSHYRPHIARQVLSVVYKMNIQHKNQDRWP